MARQCQLSGKRYNKAFKISFSHKRNPHRQQPNLQTKRVWNPEKRRWERLTLSTKAIKTITKVGLAGAAKRLG